MKVLSVQYNQLTGSIPFTVFNISRIENIAFTMNSLSGSLPNGLCNGLPILKRLSLAGNKLHGHMPTSLSNCSQLQLLSSSENDLTGEIPKAISNLIELETFNISGLREISLSKNNLLGSLPPNICSILPNVERVYLAYTNLVGTIPHSISNCSKLTILEFSYNQLTGLIPNSLGYLTHLQYLNLGRNNLTSDSSLSFLTSLSNNRNLTVFYLYSNSLNGLLPASTGNLSISLRKFYANSCKIKGRIPNEVGNISSLLDLDLSGNNLVGSIPTSIGNLRDLQRFNLSRNKLTGFIGDHICKLHYLGAIYLGQNQLSGPLPNCLGNVTSLREIHLGSNKLSSKIPPSIGNLQDLVVLDLSSNNMVGTLPPKIGNLKAATLIDLSMNRFSNGIPREIGGLQTLVHLSLRHNKLQGSIPDSMSNMVGLEFLNLSDNNILGNYSHVFGETPGSISMFLSTSCTVKYPRGVLSRTSRVSNRAPQQADSFSAITRERISYYELLQATDALSESNLIGSGSFGSALVLDYMPNGSFEKYLYSYNYFLDIKQRLSIMIDVASALEYLHHGCALPVIHCDVKPSNVLLDEDMVAHLSDFGISKLLGEYESDLYTKTLATLGYIAPEYGQDGLVSTKCDVYSCGIMLLETFTLRKPNDFEGDLSLKQWVSHSLPEDKTKE
ncbi:hypothetical protein P3S67_013485 [Capsicum chacoense]